jgi:hypothetical protein
MSTTVTCDYVANPFGETAATLAAAIAAPPVDPFTLSVTGCTINSDTSGVVAGAARRRIVLNLTPAFKASFPDGTDQTSPFWAFMLGILENAMNTPLIAKAPVVA